MAVYHFSAKTVSRSAGRSSTAAAAYRSGERIVDERTGEIHDYTRKGGVVDSLVVLPQGGTMNRAELWNKVEAHHKRGDATVAREFVVALPAELDAAQRQELARTYARELADRYGVGVDLNVHAPGKEGDQRNHHAHILLTACYCGPTGVLGKKAVELDPIHCQRQKLPNVVEVERERWESIANQALEKAGQEVRIDHRSLEAQGITDRLPGVHLGPTATAIERSGRESDIARRAREQADEFMADMQAQVALQRAAEKDVAELEAQLAQAKWEAMPMPERIERAQRLVQERAAEISDLAEQRAALYKLTPFAKSRELVEKARQGLPEAAKQAKEARAQAKALEAESESLSPWRFIRRRQVNKQLPEARERAQALEKRFMTLKGGAELPIREDLDAQIKHLDKRLEPGEAKLREAHQSVMHLEGLQQAQEAAKAREEMRMQAQAKQEALQAQIERTAATVKAGVAQRQAERAAPIKAKERDHGPSR
jgi:hypothetical protein